MKKLLTLTLAVLMLLTALVGCNNVTPPEGNPNEQQGTTNPPIGDDDYDVIIGGNPDNDNPPENNPPENNPPENNPPEDNPPVDNPPVDNPPVENPPEDNPPAVEAPESSQVASGFVAKQKKYDYGENNIIILNVTNQNEKNYSVTINGFYLDAEGKVIKSETQSVEGYAAGYEKYFIFHPEVAFNNFVFTLEADEFNGDCLLKRISVNFKKFYQGSLQINPKPGEPFYPCIYAQFEGDVNSAEDLEIEGIEIIFDASGNIYKINKRGRKRLLNGKEYNYMSSKIYHEAVEKLVWPEALGQGATGLFIVTYVGVAQ